MKLFFVKLKRNFIPLLFFAFMLCLIFFSKSNIVAVKNSLNIWINNVVPSLFPFFIATELLNNTNIPRQIGYVFNKIMRPLFNVPGIGAYALFMGIVSGYPVGAKIVTNFRNNNLCTKEEAERLITFTNNSGPLFILGTVGISLFYDSSIGILLLFTHILACLSVGIIFRFWKSKTRYSRNIDVLSNNLTFNSLGEVISKSILSAIKSIVLIGGFVVLFGIIISILRNTQILNFLVILITPLFNLVHIKTDFIIPIITGIIELTNGITMISSVASKNLGVNVIIAAFLLGFGGISITLQVLSIISKSDISIKPYMLGKLLHGILASFYTFLIISFIPYFNYLTIYWRSNENFLIASSGLLSKVLGKTSSM